MGYLVDSSGFCLLSWLIGPEATCSKNIRHPYWGSGAVEKLPPKIVCLKDSFFFFGAPTIQPGSQAQAEACFAVITARK
jgi:hypothetical protein